MRRVDIFLVDLFTIFIIWYCHKKRGDWLVSLLVHFNFVFTVLRALDDVSKNTHKVGKDL